MRKPDGLSVRDMFDRKLFQPGSWTLNPTTYPLRVDKMAYYHTLSCVECTQYGGVAPHCYFSTMLRCVTHGWHPPCDYASITPKYRTRGNYPTVALFDGSARKEFEDMRANGVLIPTTRPRLVNPMGIVLKNSDKMRARVLVQVNVVDQESLTRASERLVAAGHPKIKCRVTTDLSATGVNRASYAPPFRYPSLGDALRVIKRGGFIASGDVSRYFHTFPLAIDGRSHWCVEYGGEFWAYARCCFGHSACPYYASTWSAEFAQWARHLTLDPAWMVDDWFLCEESEASARAAMDKLCAMFIACGFAMSQEKFQYGQQIVFIGVLIDTVTMTMRFDATQARGMRLQLESYMDTLHRGRALDHTTVRHVCGKLNWYAEIVQSGRMHIKPWWDYERHGQDSYRATVLKLVQDTQWWIELLRSWEDHTSSQLEYKILSAQAIQEDGRSIMVVQSDASGVDGFGYYYGYLSDTDLKFTSKQWDEAPQVSSHAFELAALEYFLLQDCTARDCVLVWITDNEGAVWSVNKGSCRGAASRDSLVNILRVCDQRRLQIVAMWVPRERNELADYLSHLAAFVHRDQVRGRRSDLHHRPGAAGEEDQRL